MAANMSVFVNIGAKLLPSLNSAARGVETRFSQLTRNIQLRSAEMKAHMSGLETSMSRFNNSVSLPAAAATALGARMAYSWSKVGNELQAVTLMSNEARKSIEAVARALPGDPTENLRAALDLARSGFNAEQVRGTLATTIKLSRADSSVDTAAASDIMTNVMQGMKMPQDTYAQVVASAERVANNIAFGAAQSSTDVRLMGESFKYAAPLASRLGIEMETMTAYFMTMANAGIKGSEAGVALRSGMVRMLKPTKDAMAVLARYNMSLEDYLVGSKKMTAGDIVTGLKVQGLDASGQKGAISALLNDPGLTGADLVARITDAVSQGIEGGASAVDRDKISDAIMTAMTAGGTRLNFTKFLEDLTAKGVATGDLVRFFDVRQGARLETLTGGALARNMREVAAAMRVANGQGSFLDKMYAMQLQGAVGPWERMKQGFGNLIIAAAESGAMDTIANAMDRIASGVMSLSQSSPGLLKFATFLIMGAAAAAPLGWALSGIAATGRLLSGVFRLMSMGMSGLLSRLLPLRSMMVFVRYGFMAALGVSWPLVAAVTAIGVALAWVVAKWDGIKAFFAGFASGFAEAISPETIANIAKLGIVFQPFIFVLEKIGGLLSAVFGWVAQLFAPAEVDKWRSWGQAVGNVIGFVADKLGWLIGLLGRVVGGIASLTSTNPSTPSTKAPPGRALGGSVSAGVGYEWHERGREMFVPGKSGTVIPAHVVAAMNRSAANDRGSVTVGQIVIQGANDPQATARAVRAELKRMARGQSGYLSD